jgi:hypothetical protein
LKNGQYELAGWLIEELSMFSKFIEKGERKYKEKFIKFI